MIFVNASAVEGMMRRGMRELGNLRRGERGFGREYRELACGVLILVKERCDEYEKRGEGRTRYWFEETRSSIL